MLLRKTIGLARTDSLVALLALDLQEATGRARWTRDIHLISWTCLIQPLQLAPFSMTE